MSFASVFSSEVLIEQVEEARLTMRAMRRDSMLLWNIFLSLASYNVSG